MLIWAGAMGHTMHVSLFKKRSASRKARGADQAAIAEFIDSRRGVEAYLEPQTSVTKTTVVFIANDGESMRKPFDSPKAAAEFARKHRVPIYDTNKVGYPQRMRDYNTRAAGGRPKANTNTPPKSATSSAPKPASRWSPEQLKAIRELQFIAEVSVTNGDLDADTITKLIRTARAKAHPDRNGGDRSSWDRIDSIARVVDLH